MKSSRWTEVSIESSAQQCRDHNVGTDLATAWKSGVHHKAALRRIENRVQAAPGTGVLLDSVMNFPKKKFHKDVHCADGQHADDNKGSSKSRGCSQQSPDKSSSRSPLRNSTQDSNICGSNGVEFREQLPARRESTPPSRPCCQLEANTLQTVPASFSLNTSLPPTDLLLSQLDYRRDTKHVNKDQDSTCSSALENTDVCYLNDQPTLDALRSVRPQLLPTSVKVPEGVGTEEESTRKAQSDVHNKELSPFIVKSTLQNGQSTPSSSPGSASQRLENLKRHQHDNKLEKLKERIRRQRQHLEEAAEREKLLGHLEQPIIAPVEINATSNMAKTRKVASGPAAPTYKGFNISKTEIQSLGGKVWKEQDFQDLSREIYRDLSRQFAESTRSRHQQQREQRADRTKEMRLHKPVRKVHRAAPTSDLNTKSVISPASWREGQKLVKILLGPVPKPHQEDRSQPADGLSRTASRHRSTSHPRSNSKAKSRPDTTEQTCSGHQGQKRSKSTPSPREESKVSVVVNAPMLSADIQGILNDMQIDCETTEKEEKARQRVRDGSCARRGRAGLGSQTRTSFSNWGTTMASGSGSRGCHSASATRRRSDTAGATDPGQKKRHYDADTVRQYISRQKEERKQRQAEEKRALREEAERRNQRLQELYKKQREMSKTVALPSEAPVHRRLQETYNKLLLDEAQLDEEATQTQPAALSSLMTPMYQPSGESDKENKRLEAPQSPSSSGGSLTDQLPLPLSRHDLDVSPLLRADHLRPDVRPVMNADHLHSQLLRLETAMRVGDTQHAQQPTTAPSRSRTNICHIEALKATAASLSNRIEHMARRFAGEGINYGTATSVDMDTALAPRSSQVNCDDGTWIKTTLSENNDMVVLGNSSYNGTTLPGSVSRHVFGGQKEIKYTHANLTNPLKTCDAVGEPDLKIHARERMKLVNGLEKPGRVNKIEQWQNNEMIDDKNGAELHDSSGGSISEGPLLSEGSISEDEENCPHFSTNNVPRTADHFEAVNIFAGQRKDYQLSSRFQKEAPSFSALTQCLAPPNSSNAPWEELNKGSPLSVINIFIKNLQGHVRVSERNSPSIHSLQSGNDSVDKIHENDLVSVNCSEANAQLKQSPSSSATSHFEELMKRSPPEKNTGGISSHRSSFHSSFHSPNHSSGSASGSSPFSKRSSKKRVGTASDQSDATPVEEQRSSCSPPSEPISSDSRKSGSNKISGQSQTKSVHSKDASGKKTHKRKIRETRTKQPFPSSSPESGSAQGGDSPNETVRSESMRANNINTVTAACSDRAETKTTGELQYSPAVIQQCMAAELQYLESIEESIRQLDDTERLLGISMAQQESVTLAQMLKAKQQCQERDLYELKIKAEREAKETQLQMEEQMQRLARAQMELQVRLTGTQTQTVEGLQEVTMKIMSQQAEAVQHTADAARHIKEMTELARSQISGVVVAPPIATNSSLLDKQDELESLPSKLQQDTDSFQSEVSSRKMRKDESPSSQTSPNDSNSLSFSRPRSSGEDLSSHHSLSHVFLDHRKQVKNYIQDEQRKAGVEEGKKSEAGGSSIAEEVLTAADDSLYSDNIPSINGKDTTSVATEYSVKFDESVTEDEIEERSFRSLLPSESHRRGTKEKSHHHEESEDDGANRHLALVSRTHKILKDTNLAFSSGEDSFSQFTMDMVHQYMKDKQVRLQHESALLHLRQKALKEKTKAELAWLEHQKKRLRDKGEDDKMPPIRKKQRGLLIKLQQERAEIKRLQEVNKAARKESQLLLKQQEEIERMRNSTFRLRERLKIDGGDSPPETPVTETPLFETTASNMRHGEDVRSPSPSLSISGSETSSIMQKLRKMRSRMDDKFLTKREQQLMQRRHHAEELLQWKQQLDKEEAEVRRMEKEAMAVWNRHTPQDKDIADGQKIEISDISPSPSYHQSAKPRTDSEQEYASEGGCSPLTPESSIHTEILGSQQAGSPASAQSELIPEAPLASVPDSPENYSQDFTSVSQSHMSKSPQSTFKGSHSSAAFPSDSSSKVKMKICSSWNKNQAHSQLPNSQTEPISDQSDIECRVKTLKEELRKRKLMAYQLKKEQKKRRKERLKAQEASLLKQLESYDNFIEKTKAELNKETDITPDAESQIKDFTSFTEQCSIKAHTHRSDSSSTSVSERAQIDASLNYNALPLLTHGTEASVPEKLSEDRLIVTPSQVYGSPECPTSDPRSYPSTGFVRPSTMETQAQRVESGDEDIEFQPVSDIEEELVEEISSKSKDHHSEHLPVLETEDQLDFLEKNCTFKDVTSSVGEKLPSFPSASPEDDKQVLTNGTSKTEEAVNLCIVASTISNSAQLDCKTSPDLSNSPLASDHSYAVSMASSSEEPPIKDVKVSSPIEDEYEEDFDSLEYSSSRGEHHSSEPDSHISALSKHSHSRVYDSQDKETEEEIAEELSQYSGSGEDSHKSGRLLYLHNKTEESKHDTKDTVNSVHSPPISVLQTSFSPVMDEMASFNIGDRVLVGGVQPGTLRFKGPASFANGFWAGVELDKSEGSNNGTYDGVVYFACDKNHGIFAPPDKISHLPDKFEIYTDTTEDEELFFDDLPGKSGEKHQTLEDKSPVSQREGHLKSVNEQSSLEIDESRINKVSGESVHQSGSHHNLLGTFADTLLKGFVQDTVNQFAELKKTKEQKIEAANLQMNKDVFGEYVQEREDSSEEQKDGLPFFLPAEQEELSSPELCNRTESPVLGPNGQEELAKRLAELELSRELLDDLGDDQDWFDEDFGLSSRREQQRLKQKEEEPRLGRGGVVERAGAALVGLVSSPGGEQQVKIPPRPELPLPLPPKLPEQPAMVVPHSAAEVEKMVHAATQEILENCGLLKDGALTFAQLPIPKPSQEYLGKEGSSQEALCIHSYKKAVYDLTWEMLQDIYAEDPNADQSQWVKPRRVKSSYYRVKTPGDTIKIQEFVAAEVLKLYGLTKDCNQKTDWQKMLKFGRKKRDRVDQILVQELHEEEAQWVNYDEDELFVKMQMTETVFEALLKDTVNVVNEIYDKKAKRDS